MPQKALTIVSLPCLALALLGLLTASVPEEGPSASNLPPPWTAQLAGRGGPIVIPAPLDAHAAFQRPRLDVKTLKKRPRRAPLEPAVDAVPPIVRTATSVPHHQTILHDIVRLLPPSCRSQLRNLYVRYDHPSQRGLAGKSTVILSGNVPDSEFRALAVHEILGHFYELGCLNGTPDAAATAYLDGMEVMTLDDPSVGFYRISWQDADTPYGDALPEDFVSGYAYSGDAFEDLAETAVAYVLHRDMLEDLAEQNPIIAAKLRWMERYMPLDTKNVATGRYAMTGERPWDMTKLAYDWHGQGKTVATR